MLTTHGAKVRSQVIIRKTPHLRKTLHQQAVIHVVQSGDLNPHIFQHGTQAPHIRSEYIECRIIQFRQSSISCCRGT